MKASLSTVTSSFAESGGLVSNYTSTFGAKQPQAIDEELMKYSTIDGGMITYHAGADAVSSGIGILIGDYFVGAAETYNSFDNAPLYVTTYI